MDIIAFLIDFILHVDLHLAELIQQYGVWTYLILFLVIFCETGLVFTPFLPGDSLLFVIGALAADGFFNTKLITLLLMVAAVGGNTTNYFIGRFIGQKILNSRSRLIRTIVKKEYIDRTHVFYEKHGGKAVFLSRFMPIIRTFAPFVAGVGKMPFAKFTFFNTLGGITWSLLFISAGYFFGAIPAVQHHFTYVIFAIVAISLLPAVIAAWNKRRK
ncbi:MAG: DedA family protein [Peptococcaceae bacterium]|jgi:membrane-associated protein|nr:DedA family protein [Peptococcaceae bacterium]